jgi:hypothetical protein
MKFFRSKFWLAVSLLTLLITVRQAIVHEPEDRASESALPTGAPDFERSALTQATARVGAPQRQASAQSSAVPNGLSRAPQPLSKSGPVQGNSVESYPAQMNPQTLKGRTVGLRAADSALWSGLQKGSEIHLPAFDEEIYEGFIVLRLEDQGWLRFGGQLKNAAGTFSLHFRDGVIGGTILLPEKGIGLEIRTETNGEVLLVERTISQLVCWKGPPLYAAAVADGGTSAASSGTVPQINTRPGAKGLIYLHFTGGTITDPDWNGGAEIVAAPSALSADGIREVVARVAEDYAPFDMAVSTITADYEAMTPGRRMRVIVTPTNKLQAGVGGLSLVGSWPSAGRIRSSTVPVWVFNSSVKTIAEAASHEVAHTLGLSHDGTLGAEYYSGNGLDGSPTNWAPIMGNSYSRPLTQWSKGEYLNANNTEDDLAIIASLRNGVGFGANTPGANPETAPTLNVLNVDAGTFSVNGVLRQSQNADRYQFTTRGGTLSVTASPVSSGYTNADLQLELYKQTPGSVDGVLLSRANPLELLESTLKATDLSEGTYQIWVRSAASSEPFYGTYISGYSAYGSLGPYRISGTLENTESFPSILSPATAMGALGIVLNIPVRLSQGARVTAMPSGLPPGIVWNSTASSLVGTPTTTGSYSVSFQLQSSKGQTTQTLPFSIDYPLPLINGMLGAYVNSPTSPWTGQLVPFSDNTSVRAAVSGRPGNSGSSRLRLRIPGKSTLVFWWKTSSEAGHDWLECRINGVLAKDLDTGNPVRLSGETSWVRQKIRVDLTSTSLLEFAYTKDATLTEGEDRGWIAKVEMGVQPLFKKSPQSIRLKTSDQMLTLSATVENANTFQWKKDGIPLTDGSLAGHEVSGSTTQTLVIKGVRGADSGDYTLSASNNFETITSRKADVVIPSAPVIVQTIPPIGPLRTGNTLILGVEANGAAPYISSWKKDGRPFARVSGTFLKLGSATPLMSGTYSVSVLNAFGTSASVNIPVTVLPRP